MKRALHAGLIVLLVSSGVTTAQRRALRPLPAARALEIADGIEFGTELAGVRCNGYPHFTFVSAFNAGDPVTIGIDTGRMPSLANRTVDVYVARHRPPAQWIVDPSLVDISDPRGVPLTITPVARSLRENVFQIDAGTLHGITGTPEVGVGYDVVIDYNRNGLLDRADFIDGWGSTAGFYVMPDLTQPGPYASTSRLYNGGRFKRQKIYHPSNVATLGRLPLVMIGHGNGHSFRWYDHIGEFLSSWGYIVVSHENNTGPGIETASTTTLQNTKHFLGNLDVVAGGELESHVDSSSIVWMGHSRGGEGVVRAYRRLVDGDPIASNFSASDIKLISSIAPTNFIPATATPRSVPYHLWTGTADNDVSGCANCDQCQTFQLHERAQGRRFSTSVFGAGHADFHDGGGDSVASGPCRIGRNGTHKVMLGYLLPLLAHVVQGNVPCKDYLWRQYESFRPIGIPSSSCFVVDLMFREDPALPRYVVDDFQAEPDTFVSSSGGAVDYTVAALSEARYDDGNRSFTTSPNAPMNGMTLAGNRGNSRGLVFEWTGPSTEHLMFEITPDGRDITGYEYLSFRAAQATRHPLTTLELGDVTFSVQLIDSQGRRSTIRIDAYGGGIEEPYQRRTCGQGAGWANDFETIRIPLMDFQVTGHRIDLHSITAVAFLFGPKVGSAQGRIGLDEIELTSDGAAQ